MGRPEGEVRGEAIRGQTGGGDPPCCRHLAYWHLVQAPHCNSSRVSTETCLTGQQLCGLVCGLSPQQ